MTPNESVMKRYSDAYVVARTIDGIGSGIKALGAVIGVIGVLFGLYANVANSSTSDYFTVVGIAIIIVAVAIWLFIHIAGVLISAQGQILKASLDGAVNGSPFLSNEERAKVMSL